MNIKFLKDTVEEIILSEKTTSEKLQAICDFLEAQISYYDWVGFYFKNGDKLELKLGPYVGEPTDHTIIPFGKGICGQVAVSNENFVVPANQDYLVSCLEVEGKPRDKMYGHHDGGDKYDQDDLRIRFCIGAFFACTL